MTDHKIKKDFAEPIQFFVPHGNGLDAIPLEEREVWSWICSNPSFPEGREGRLIWTVYTYLILKARGVDCALVRHFPENGIVITHRDFLPSTYLPRPNTFLICIKAGRKQHSWAQAYIVQNASDPIVLNSDPSKIVFPVPNHWPQPSLLPRDSTRGSIVKSIAYFGLGGNLDSNLRTAAWTNALVQIGLGWQIMSRRQWHDYQTIDVTVSVRSFDQAQKVSDIINSADVKPASKLINSWTAGVPAIVGKKPAYLAVKRTPLDFLIVQSKSEIIDALLRLQSDPVLYSEMVANGFERSREFTVDSTAEQWASILKEHAVPAYTKWQGASKVSRITKLWKSYINYWCRPTNVSHGFLGLFSRYS